LPAVEAAEAAVHSVNVSRPRTPADPRRVLGVLRYLLRIDQAVVELAGDLTRRIPA